MEDAEIQLGKELAKDYVHEDKNKTKNTNKNK